MDTTNLGVILWVAILCLAGGYGLGYFISGLMKDLHYTRWNNELLAKELLRLSDKE